MFWLVKPKKIFYKFWREWNNQGSHAKKIKDKIFLIAALYNKQALCAIQVTLIKWEKKERNWTRNLSLIHWNLFWPNIIVVAANSVAGQNFGLWPRFGLKMAINGHFIFIAVLLLSFSWFHNIFEKNHISCILVSIASFWAYFIGVLAF